MWGFSKSAVAGDTRRMWVPTAQTTGKEPCIIVRFFALLSKRTGFTSSPTRTTLKIKLGNADASFMASVAMVATLHRNVCASPCLHREHDGVPMPVFVSLDKLPALFYFYRRGRRAFRKTRS